jgi:hypothetical protein
MILFLTILTMTISTASAENITVNPNESINDAISQINSGSDINNTINLNPGTYNKNSDINNNIVRSDMNLLIKSSDNNNKAIIDAQELGNIFNIAVNSNTNISFEGIIFKNGKTTSNGGAIFNSDGKLTVKNCQFQGNSGYNGGAIFNGGQNSLIVDSNFSNNHDTLFGAAIYNNAINFSIIGSIFVNNTAGSEGGAIHNSNSNFSLINSSLIKNTGGWGGALKNTGHDSYIINSNFTNNSAYSGGAIDNSGTNLFINGSIFSSNSAVLGGAIENQGFNLYVINSAFMNNKGTYGAAIDNSGDNFHVIDSNFTNNSGNTGIILINGNNLHAEINGVIMVDNNCTAGLVGISDGSKDNVLDISNSVFENNTVGGDLFYSTNKDNTINPTNITSNGNTIEYPTVLDIKVELDKNNKITVTVTANNPYLNKTLSNITINLYRNNVKVWSGKTNANGMVTYVSENNEPGLYVFMAEFIGLNITNSTGTYINMPSVVNTSVTVNSIKTYLSIKNIKGKYKSNVKLVATLKDANGNLLRNKDVNFYVGNTKVGFTKTNSKGIATLNYKISKTGTFNLNVQFVGDGEYDSSVGSSKLSVPKASNIKIKNGKIVKRSFVTMKTVIANTGYNKVKTVLKYRLPKGFVYKKPSVSTGKISYNKRTRILTWTISSLKVSNSKSAVLYWKMKTTKRGWYSIKPVVSKATGLKVVSNNKMIFKVKYI